MANLVINTYCNLKCPYCFAEDEKQTYVNQEMTEENFKKAVNWITKTDDRVGIIGGEPTLHSKFGDYMMYLINNPKVNTIMLYTNGTHMEKYLTLLSNHKVRLLVNLNHPEVVGGEKKLNKILDNIEKLIALKKDNDIEESQLSIGLNLYKPGQDYQFFIDALKRFDMHTCRMSVSIENIANMREYDPMDYFKKMKDTLVNFLWDLIKIDCITREDCNFIPKCLFEEQELDTINAELHRVARKHNICPSEAEICVQSCVNGFAPLDIHPDLTASKCFGCSEYDKQNIHDHCDWQHLNNYFRKSITDFSRIIPFSKVCTTECKYYSECYAGCMKYKLNKIDILKETLNKV